MIDTVTLLDRINLHDLIECDAPQDAKGNKRLFCPFCQVGARSGPAMQVYDQRYHCFGCGADGTAIDYMMLRNRVGFLDACRMLGWKGDNIGSEELTKVQNEYQAQRREDEKKRAERLSQLLAEFTSEEIWLAFQNKMAEEHVIWWESQGISLEWQKYLKVGYTADKAYYDKDKSLRHSPAYTIPYFHFGFVFKNMQYRLQDAINPKDRYRFESNLKTTYYMVTPSKPIGDKVIVCEGAKKAMCAKIMGDLEKDYTFLAVPSKVDFGGIAEVVKDCGLVIVVPDPDAWIKPINAAADWLPPPIKLARSIGKSAFIMRLPVKIDDGIIQYQLQLKTYLRMLVKP